MFILFHLLRSKIFWSLLALVLAGLIVYGFYLDRKEAASAGMVNVSALMEKLEQDNPAAYRRMQELTKQYGASAVAASNALYEQRYGASALDELSRDLATGRSEATRMVQLASLSIEGKGQLSDGAQDYITLISALIDQKKSTPPSQQQFLEGYVSQYITEQQQAQREGGETWQTVCQYPFSINIYRALRERSPEGWSYYTQHASWLSDALLLLSLYDVSVTNNSGDTPLRTDTLYEHYLSLCTRYPSMASYTEMVTKQWQQAVASEELSGTDSIPAPEIAAHLPMIYAMYRNYGDAIEQIYQQTGAPIEECVDVLLANHELYKSALAAGTQQALITDIVQLHKQDKEIWKLIGMETNALLLYQSHKEKARDVLYNYSPDGITHLIVESATSDAGEVNTAALRQAIEAVARFQDIALYVLHEHGGDHRFSQILARDYRSVIYLAFHGSEGLNHLSSEDWRGYLDKELTAEGMVKKEDWIGQLPLGGALYTIANNQLMGYPSSWSELGWASVEVAEIGLAIATLGTASAATTAGKAAVKAGVKTSLKTGAKSLHRQALRGSTRSEATAGFRKAFALRGSSRFLSGKVATALRASSSAILRAGSLIYRPSRFITRGLARGWRAASPAMRQRAFRLSAIALISVETYYRTLPHTGDIVAGVAQQLSRLATQVIQGSIRGFQDMLHSGARSVQQLLEEQGVLILAPLLALIGVYLILSLAMRPKFRKQSL